MTAITIEVLQQRVSGSELGREFARDPLLERDVWSLAALGYTDEDIKSRNQRHLYFKDFHLPWLKLLVKLTVKAKVRQRHSTGSVVNLVCRLRQLDKFLMERGFIKPEDLSDRVIQEFMNERTHKESRCRAMVFTTELWSEEGWLNVPFVPSKTKRYIPKIEVIPEEVLHQVYENMDMFPPPLERMFRLQIALGCRIGELPLMPRACLKQEGDKWFILRWIGKQKKWKFFQVHSLVAQLVQEQQKFLDSQFALDSSNFDKLFCSLSTGPYHGNHESPTLGRFQRQIIYMPEILGRGLIGDWLRAFSKAANLRDKYGNSFKLRTHMFRRTKASIMAYCETEDEYIAAVLGHGSLDMLPHYRKQSLERLEKEAKAKGYVDLYGRVTTFKPKKRRYEQLAELLKVSTPLGECHRPAMLGDCAYRYACLGCDHHRVTAEDRPKLEADRDSLHSDLKSAQVAGLTRRETEINRLLELIENRLRGLNNLQTMLEGHANG